MKSGMLSLGTVFDRQENFYASLSPFLSLFFFLFLSLFPTISPCRFLSVSGPSFHSYLSSSFHIFIAVFHLLSHLSLIFLNLSSLSSLALPHLFTAALVLIKGLTVAKSDSESSHGMNLISPPIGSDIAPRRIHFTQ